MKFGFDRRSSSRRRAFTLVELLVVIGIIAALIAILLPVLSKARRAAMSLKCMANLRSLAQAMQIYAADNNGWIIGSGCTTGLPFYPTQFKATLVDASPPAYNNTNVPGWEPIYPSDYITPMIVEMRLSANVVSIAGLSGDMLLNPVAANRYYEYVNMPEFQCPSYAGTTVTPNNGSWAGTVPALSYVTAWAFLMSSPYQVPSLGGVTGVTRISSAGGRWPQTPTGFLPKITKIGDNAAKIFMADGAKGFIYKSTFGTAPAPYGSYDLTVPQGSGNWYDDNNGSIGSFTDLGPWSLMSGAYDRSANPANGGAAYPSDPRAMAYRHGGTKNGTFRMNAVFFDGHGETLTEIQSANPSLWLPKGTVTPTTPAGFVYPDTVKSYLLPNGFATIP